MIKRLSEHFCYSEIFEDKKSGKVSSYEIAKAILLCRTFLEPARTQLGGDIPINISSGKRSAAHNRNVGGSKQSYHLFTGSAAAVDFSTGNPAYNAEIFRWLHENRAHAYGELIAYLAASDVMFIHVALPTESKVGKTMISNHRATREYPPFKGVLQEPKR